MMIRGIVIAVRTWIRRMAQWREKSEEYKNTASHPGEVEKKAKPGLKDTGNLDSTVSDFRSPLTTTSENCEREQVSVPSGEIEAKLSVGASDGFSAPGPVDSFDVSKRDDATAGDVPSEFASAECEEAQISPKPSGDAPEETEKDNTEQGSLPTEETEITPSVEAGDGFTAPRSTNSSDVTNQDPVGEADPLSGFTSSVGREGKMFEKGSESPDMEPEETKTEAKASVGAGNEFSVPRPIEPSGVSKRNHATAENVSSDFVSAESHESEEERVPTEPYKEVLEKKEKNAAKPASSPTEETEMRSLGDVSDGFAAPRPSDSPDVSKRDNVGPTDTLSGSAGSEKSEKEMSNKLPRQMPARRMPRNATVKPSEATSQLPRQKPEPELICRYGSEEGKWEIVLSVPNDTSDSVEVRHDEKSLYVKDGEYRLSSFSGNLSVVYCNGEVAKFPLFDGESPLIFKFKSHGQEHGKRIGALTKGAFLLFAPSNWTRLGDRSDDYEGCVDPEFLAHHFFRGQDDSTDCIGGFEECEILTSEGFVLQGKRVMDDSPDGDLFVGFPPTLNPAQGIAYAQIGEERPGGWKSGNFNPADDSLEKILDGRQGRFFVRVYNDEASLVDSDEFRYFSDLIEILVNGERYAPDIPMIPPPKGHPPAILQFMGTDGIVLHPKLKNDNPRVTSGQDGMIKIEPSCPESDETVWSLSSERSAVEVEIRLPRVWWRFQRPDIDSGEWLDKPSDMTREEFRDHAKEGVSIRLFLPSSVKTILAGFNDDLTRRFNVADELRFDLFVDYPEIAQHLDSTAELKIRCCGEELTLARIAPDISLKLQEIPVARVNRPGGGRRRGKGFSIGELGNAGLVAVDANRLGLRIDSRRRSVHQFNTDILIEVMKNA